MNELVSSKNQFTIVYRNEKKSHYSAFFVVLMLHKKVVMNLHPIILEL